MCLREDRIPAGLEPGTCRIHAGLPPAAPAATAPVPSAMAMPPSASSSVRLESTARNRLGPARPDSRSRTSVGPICRLQPNVHPACWQIEIAQVSLKRMGIDQRAMETLAGAMRSAAVGLERQSAPAVERARRAVERARREGERRLDGGGMLHSGAGWLKARNHPIPYAAT